MVIAEIGLNHGGKFNKAVEMIHAAAESGARAAKFQYYLTDTLCLNRNCFENYKLLDSVRMHPQWIPPLARECKICGVEFLCTAFCRYSCEEIAPYVRRFKIASPEACDLDFVRHVASYGKPVILSTGMITQKQLDAVMEAVTVPVVLLYCVSKYPAAASDYNLDEITRLHERYRVPVGISDHTNGIRLAIEASEQGAFLIEKHFMIERGCVDEAVSIMPRDMKKLTEVVYGRKDCRF